MTKSNPKQPTDLELEILKVVWDDHPTTVRQVREALAAKRKLAYTTVMTVMGILTDKGFLKRVKEGTGYVYSPVVKREHAMKRMVKDVTTRWFDGSTGALLLNLIDDVELDKNELAELKRLLDKKLGEKS